MKRSLALLAAVAGLAAAPGSALAAPACSHGQPAGVAPLYCIPPTPAAAASSNASAASSALSGLSASALAGKGSVQLHGAASGPGTVTIVITATIHGRVVTLGRGSQSATAAGGVAVKLTLTKAGKAALKGHKGKLKLTVTATFKPQHGAAKTAKGKATLK